MDSQLLSSPTLSAVRVLANAGVSDRVLGSVVRELLGSPGVVAPVPGFAASAVAPVPVPPAATAPAPPALPEMVPVKLRFPNGKATNIAVPSSIFAAARKKMGSDVAARKWLRELALAAPASVGNRSKWVQQRVLEVVGPATLF